MGGGYCRVFFIQYLTRRPCPNGYGAAFRCFFGGSYQEGFGNHAIEASYFKKPLFIRRYSVFVSDIEPLGFKTITINEKIKPSHLREVQRILEDKAYANKVTLHNFRLAKKHFSLKVLEEKLEKILGQIL